MIIIAGWIFCGYVAMALWAGHFHDSYPTLWGGKKEWYSTGGLILIGPIGLATIFFLNTHKACTGGVFGRPRWIPR